MFPATATAGATAGECGRWVDLARGRAVRGATGSAAVWSRRTGYGTALVVGAIHTLGEGWLGDTGTPILEEINDPAAQIGVPRLFLATPDAPEPDVLASPWFGLYHPAVAAQRNNNLMQDVLPREDFYVAVTDSQKLDVAGPAPAPEPIVLRSVPLYDPGEVTTAPATYAAAAAGDLVLLLGYPNETGRLAAAVGRVLSDEAATQAVTMLADLGDPEGAVPYDPEVELIIEGAATAGMSGGPVVDAEGRLLGVLVRASDEHDGTQYVRAVRMTYIADRLATAYAALPADARQTLVGYLES